MQFAVRSERVTDKMVLFFQSDYKYTEVGFRVGVNHSGSTEAGGLQRNMEPLLLTFGCNINLHFWFVVKPHTFRKLNS